jgi:hypothetical protein
MEKGDSVKEKHAGCVLWVAGCGVRVARCGLRVARLRVAKYGLRGNGFKAGW